VMAPMIALIAPAFNLLALAVNGAPPAFDWGRAALVWWLAETAGVLVVAPLILAWARRRESPDFGASAAAELAARERLDMNRRLFDSLPTGLLILRLDKPGDAESLRIVDINPAGRALAGAGDAPVAGLPMREFSPEFHETGLDAECLAVLRTGETRVIEEFLSPRKVPGAYFNLTLLALSEREVAIAFENVTERKKARQMLQDNAQLLLLMIESVREYAIFRVDQAGRVSSWSRGAELVYGYAPAEILGSPYARLLPADAPPLKQLTEVSREGRLKTESWCVRKNGDRFWADTVLTALRGEAGSDLGCVVVVRDATQRRASAQVLERRAAELSRSNQELSQFAYVASHDLSAPLHKVKAFADRLKDKLEGKLDEEGRDYLRRMMRSVDGMQTLIDALLELARVSTRGAAAAEVDLGALVKEVVENLEHPAARVDIGALPRINADPLQMRQLMQNLVSNALKFHKPGSSPHVRIHGKATGDGLCEIVVSDNGIGFDMRFAERIFQPFQRLQAPQEYAGTGMGLAICQKIAARHGGTITASSEPGRGAEFKVTLPISQEGRMECQPREKALS
ncbi:MAG: ATP-binding protein, partial [Elusimicrobia bacterium]|nr:ATP-binding protein [Elusimicrobiota bacterium]